MYSFLVSNFDEALTLADAFANDLRITMFLHVVPMDDETLCLRWWMYRRFTRRESHSQFFPISMKFWNIIDFAKFLSIARACSLLQRTLVQMHLRWQTFPQQQEYCKVRPLKMCLYVRTIYIGEMSVTHTHTHKHTPKHTHPHTHTNTYIHNQA